MTVVEFGLRDLVEEEQFEDDPRENWKVIPTPRRRQRKCTNERSKGTNSKQNHKHKYNHKKPEPTLGKNERTDDRYHK